MNKQVYNLEMVTTDKLGRAKSVQHVGVFDNTEKLDRAKANILENNPNVSLRIHICEHLFFEQRPV